MSLALLKQLEAAAQAEPTVFQQHPDAAIFTSFPGLLHHIQAPASFFSCKALGRRVATVSPKSHSMSEAVSLMTGATTGVVGG